MDNEEPTANVNIETREGKTTIVFRKAALKGKVSSGQVLSTILIAAQMQAEKYIEKLSRGAPLDVSEIKALKELAEITKMQVVTTDIQALPAAGNQPVLDEVKAGMYKLLSERLGQNK